METEASFLGQKVVLDLASPYVCLGKLTRIETHYYVLEDADLHDLRDSPTTRENYVIASKSTGIKVNRKQVLIRITEVVAMCLFKNIADEESD